MDLLLIGKYVNTHGLKGEIRIISDFRFKSLIFQAGKIIYIGKDKNPFIIKKHRVHKNYDLVSFKNISNINEIEDLKNSLVYIDQSLFDFDIPPIETLIGYKIYFKKEFIGTVIDYYKEKAYDILVVSERRMKIPYIDVFIKEILKTEKKIYLKKKGVY